MCPDVPARHHDPKPIQPETEQDAAHERRARAARRREIIAASVASALATYLVTHRRGGTHAEALDAMAGDDYQTAENALISAVAKRRGAA